MGWVVDSWFGGCIAGWVGGGGAGRPPAPLPRSIGCGEPNPWALKSFTLTPQTQVAFNPKMVQVGRA
jgi:hypothetical protein